MAYEMNKEEILEHLRFDAVYFPFEQINDYKRIINNEKELPIEKNVKTGYLEFFKCVKKECINLINADKTNENADLWAEAIDEINKII